MIARINDAEVIEKILTHPDVKAANPETSPQPLCRVPSQRLLLDRARPPEDRNQGLRRQPGGRSGGRP